MRIEIQSNDRIGISQEILAVFAQQAWDLKAVEVNSCFTYVHIAHSSLKLIGIHKCLQDIAGIIRIKEITMMPSEQREHHLQMVLDRMPDPMIDIDPQGIILAVNLAAKKLIVQEIKNADNSIVGQSIDRYINQKIEHFLTDKPSTYSITFHGKTYLADISPVLSQNQQSTGAVITLHSMNAVGRQLALMQSYQENSFDNILGQSDEILSVKAQCERFAQLDLPVLISGETGTGKELIARALHQKSHRAKAPFLAINCAALPEHLLESEIFGYSAGAFTGAKKSGKPGLIELAEGGSIFLDEIAEMSVYLQAKLLRFLQDFSYRRVGGTKELHANVRIISASHQDLVKNITQQTFREDLYYRLNVLSINIPSLKERTKDIVLLAKHFVHQASLQVNQSVKHKLNPPTLTQEALQALMTYQWPGNIRQLQNVLFSVVALNEENEIDGLTIQKALDKLSQHAELKIPNITQSPDWESAQAEFENLLLKELYPLYPTTRKLAERLKVSHNKIAMKLRKYRIKN